MRTRRTLWLVLLAAATVPSTSAGQRPVADDVGVPVIGARTGPARIGTGHIAAQRLPLVVDRTRVAELDSLLPILDDAGQVISEDDIRAAMSDGSARRLMFGSLGALVGLVVFQLALPTNGDADCDIYEPCTEREEYYREWGLVAGALSGALVVGMAPEYGRDRYKAVEFIRALRRGASPVR